MTASNWTLRHDSEGNLPEEAVGVWPIFRVLTTAAIPFSGSFLDSRIRNFSVRKRSPPHSAGWLSIIECLAPMRRTKKAATRLRVAALGEAPPGFEPGDDGFAIRCLSHLATAPYGLSIEPTQSDGSSAFPSPDQQLHRVKLFRLGQLSWHASDRSPAAARVFSVT